MLFRSLEGLRVKQAVRFADRSKVSFAQDDAGVLLRLGEVPAGADTIVELTVAER